ncbi:hypothetical protein BDV10DRAFT_182675 [Aspergillus recurvatus]
MAKKSTFNFLPLPLKARLRIYDFLLLSRYTAGEIPKDRAQNSYGKQIFVDPIRPQDLYGARRARTMHPAILHTCKQTHKEAASTLYAKNSFSTHSPNYMLRFFTQIGPFNTKHIEELNLILPWTASSHLQHWLLFLKLAECWSPMQMRRGAKERGLGDNVALMPALATVTQVSDLFIGGFYAKNWLDFLKKEMEGHDVNVMAEAGDFAAMLQGGLGDSFSSRVEEFQRGTEKLWP